MESALFILGALAIGTLFKRPYLINNRVYYADTFADAVKLHRVHQKVVLVLADLELNTNPVNTHGKLDENIARLIRVYPEVTFSTHKPVKDGAVAYSAGKKHVNLCVRKDGAEVTDGALLYVTLHELAHCATEQYDPQDPSGKTIHSQDFIDVLERLYSTAEKIGILNRAQVVTQSFCGQRL